MLAGCTGGTITSNVGDGAASDVRSGPDGQASGDTRLSGDPSFPGGEPHPMGDLGPDIIDAVIAAMPENSWKSLPNTPMAAVCPTSLNHYSCDYVMAAWGGGAYDSVRDRLIIFGGGHADSFYNNVFAFDLSTSQWLRLTELPTPLDNLPDGTALPAAFTDIRIESCGLYPKTLSLNIPAEWLTPTGYLEHARCDEPSIAAQLDPQQPRSVHSYGNIAYSPTTQAFYNLGSSALFQSGQCTAVRMMAFDFDTQLWSRKADNVHIQIGGASATAGNGHIFYIVNGGLYEYDPNADTWTTHESGAAAESYYAGAAVDTVRNHLLVTDDGQHLQQWALGTIDLPLTSIATTGLSAPLNSQLGFEYVTSLDRFVAWAGGSTVYFLHPTTLAWTAVTTGGDAPGEFPSNGVYGRIRYSPRHNVLVLARSTSENVLLYKLPATAP